MARILRTVSGKSVKGFRFMEVIGYLIFKIKNILFLLQKWK